MAEQPKIRNLGKYGVLTDPDPYDLPPEAFSMAVNCRFRNGRVTSSPVFRSVENLGQLDPRFLASANPTSGLDLLMIGYKTGRVFRYTTGVETDYSIVSYVDTISDGTWTTCHLADVFYINREDRVPWSLSASNSQFQPLANWNAAWSTKLLRGFNSALVALNVTKAGVQTQTMVKTSSFALAGTVPSSWDQTDPSTNATENILAEMEGPIIDASNFGDSLCIYSTDQTWLMQASGVTSIYNYRKLPFQKGAINANCSIQIDGRQVVFGPDDIWTHDGFSEKSICEGRVRDFIYASINMSKANRCFILHNRQLNELHFCYVSGDRIVAFSGTEGCNRQAVWNYVNDTWTFDDLPFVFSGCRANLDSTTTYATVTTTYATIGGTYQDQEDTSKRVLCYVGDTYSPASLTKSLYAFDPYGVGSIVSYAVDVNATKTLYLERDGIDLDVLGANLQGYKQMNYIVPQGRIDQTSSATIDFQFGAADGYNVNTVYSPWIGYNGVDLFKCDFGDSGRYLSMHIRFLDYKSMSLSGFDFDWQVTAER